MTEEINIKEMDEDEMLELMQEDLYDGYADENVFNPSGKKFESGSNR